MSTLTLLAVAEVVWIVGFSVWIILERRSPTATLAWVLSMAWLPVVGLIVYLLVGPRRLSRKKRRHAAARSRIRQASCAKHTASGDPSPFLPADERLRQFMHLVERTGEGPPLRCERLELLTTGDECYAQIEGAIAAAQHHVHLEYYIWEPDRVGTRWRDLLCEKSGSGVEVRLLLDAIGSSRLGRRFLAPLHDAGVEVAWFNPLRLPRFHPGLINFRTHRKIVICDGRVGFTGGTNVCDEHSLALQQSQAWRDTHLRLEGPPVGWLQTVFLEDWEFATEAAPVHARYFPEATSAATGPWVQIIASGPDRDLHAIHQFYFAAISGARQRLLITTPYFVPDESICAALTCAALRGVEVRVLVPQRGDSRLVMAAARSYYEDLARFGVRFFEYEPSMLHAKTMVVDHDLGVVGTANLDNRSFRLNFEIIAAVYSRPFADEMAQIFDEDLRLAEPYRPGRAKRAPAWHRMAEATARLISPLL